MASLALALGPFAVPLDFGDQEGNLQDNPYPPMPFPFWKSLSFPKKALKEDRIGPLKKALPINIPSDSP